MRIRRIPYLHLIPILLISFTLYKMVNEVDVFLDSLSFIFSLLNPFIWAFAIAYLLNPMMVKVEKELKLKRSWSILIVYILVLGLIVLGITIVSPRIANSIVTLLKDLPYYLDTTEKWGTEQLENLNIFDKYGVRETIEQHLSEVITQVSDYLNNLLTALVTKLITITSGFLKFLIGLIMSIYLLYDKEGFIKNAKRVTFAIFSEKKATGIVSFTREVDGIFSQYLIGKLIDSTIIAILCYIGLSFIKAPYPLLLSILIGITNMIPYFGPFIGMVPATLITVFYSPIKALWVLVFIFLLQQFDGLYLGPKILGDKVGIGPFWIISAISIGGGTFGVMGMLLAVPIVAVIKTILEKYIDRRLNNKNINL